MADYDSGLPVRTENAGDVVAQICDATVSSQRLAVDGSGRIVAKAQDGAGNALTSSTAGATQPLDVAQRDAAGALLDPRVIRALTNTDVVTAEQGGIWIVRPSDGTNAQDFLPTGEATVSLTTAIPAGANVIGAITQSGVWNSRTQDGAGNAITSSVAGAAQPLDVALRDGAGNLFSGTNPLPISTSASLTGVEINVFNAGSAVALAATSSHDYTVTTGKTLQLTQVESSASGKMKVEVQVEGPALTFTTKFVQFNSTANTNTSIKLASPIDVVAGLRVRVIRTNLDKAAQDLYSTISGQEV